MVEHCLGLHWHFLVRRHWFVCLFIVEGPDEEGSRMHDASPWGLAHSRPLIPVHRHKIARLDDHAIILLVFELQFLLVLISKSSHIIAYSFEHIGEAHTLQSLVLVVFVVVQVQGHPLELGDQVRLQGENLIIFLLHFYLFSVKLYSIPTHSQNYIKNITIATALNSHVSDRKAPTYTGFPA